MKAGTVRRMVSLAAAGTMVMSLVCAPVIAESTVESTVENTESGLNAEVKGATEQTKAINQAVYETLHFENRSESANAVKGLIAALEELEIKNADGKVIWSQKAFDFVEEGDAPDTVNPSLWENTKDNHAYGLFEVVDGIYQVRGYDMANLTLVAGDTGWIIFDTTMGTEVSQAAMDLVNENLGERPIKAVIISHPHVDHFGGIRTFVSEDTIADSSLPIEEQLESGKIPVIVPEGFAEHAITENLYAGAAMGRRSNYMYGALLDRSETGVLSVGIGMGQSKGHVSYIMPSYEVKETGETMTIDGVELEFQMTPGTEAPAEMNTYIPKYKALWAAENCTGSLHNLYTLRGAEIRDGNAWAKYIMEAVSRYGDKAEVVFQSHNWPHWGKDEVRSYMINTAAVYKFINDQTLTYINQGYNGEEIENMIELPERLAQNWFTRQYYGTYAHDARAAYQKYMGWYDANPVHLNPLPQEESAKKWVEYMDLNGVDEVLAKAKEDFDKGEYQLVSEVTNTIVFADPTNQEARYLCADALEQLGYQAEAGTWRGCYLMGAMELREGNSSYKQLGSSFASEIMQNLTPDMVFDYMDIILDKPAMTEKDFTIRFTMQDTGISYRLYLVDGVLLYAEDDGTLEADETVVTSSKAMVLLLNDYEKFAENAKIEGDDTLLKGITEHLNAYDTSGAAKFNIIEP